MIFVEVSLERLGFSLPQHKNNIFVCTQVARIKEKTYNDARRKDTKRESQTIKQ